MALRTTLLVLVLLASPAAAVTLPPTLTAPVDSTTYKSPIDLAYTLPEAPLSGSVSVTFSGTDGPFVFARPDSQSFSGTLDVSSVTDGTYTVTLAYQNFMGDPVATDVATNVTIDKVTNPPTLTEPVAASTVTTSIPINLVLPESPLAGSVKLTFDGANGHVELTLSVSVGGWAFQWDPQTDPTLLSEVASVTGGPLLADGTYDVTLEYRDAVGNPAASVTNAGVIVATQTTTTTTSTTTTSTTTTTTTTSTTTTTTTSTTTTTTAEPTTTTTTAAATTTTSTTLPATCTGGVPISDAVLTIKHVDAVAGNETLRFTGRLQLPAGTPAVLAPESTGAQVLIRETSPLFALTAAEGDPIPPGVRGTGCGPKDGWSGLRYANRSGFVDPPACVQSAHGLRTLALRDKRAQGKGVLFAVKTARTTLLDHTPSGAIEAMVALGGTADLLAGTCGVVVFSPSDCTARGRTLRCRTGARRNGTTAKR